MCYREGNIACLIFLLYSYILFPSIRLDKNFNLFMIVQCDRDYLRFASNSNYIKYLYLYKFSRDLKFHCFTGINGPEA